MSKPKVIDMVFEGGGMKGVAFISALRALADYGYQPGRLLGTSVGSLIAAMLAAGYTPAELFEKIFDTETGAFRIPQFIKPIPPFETAQIDASATRRFLREVDLPFMPDGIEGSFDTWLARILMKHPPLKPIFAYIEKGGIWDPEPYFRWIGSLLDAKISTHTDKSSSEITLAQFHHVTGCLFSIIAADVTNPTMLILNHLTAPDCPLIEAIRMGVSAPTLFPPVIWKAEWGFYRQKELTGDLISDGALLSNFPIELFLSQQPQVVDVMGKPDENAGVLGLLLDESLAVPGAPRVSTPNWQMALNELPGVDLFNRMIKTVIEARDRRVIETASEYIVHLPAMGYAPNMVNLSREQVQPLLNAGHNAMITYLETHQIPTGDRLFNELTKRQVDNRAMQIINVYGNLIRVNQDIENLFGTATGVKTESDHKKGEVQMLCQKCKAELYKDAKFCQECGSPVPKGSSLHVDQKVDDVKGDLTGLAAADGASIAGVDANINQNIGAIEEGGAAVGAAVSGQGGNVHVGGKQSYGDRIEGDKHEVDTEGGAYVGGSVSTQGGDFVGRDKISHEGAQHNYGNTYSGDFRGAILNVQSTLTNVTQSINNVTGADESVKDNLKELVAQLTSTLERVPPERTEDAEAVATFTESMIEQASAGKPNKVLLQITGDGLKKAAENIADVMPTVLGIATQIVGVILGLGV